MSLGSEKVLDLVMRKDWRGLNLLLVEQTAILFGYGKLSLQTSYCIIPEVQATCSLHPRSDNCILARSDNCILARRDS